MKKCIINAIVEHIIQPNAFNKSRYSKKFRFYTILLHKINDLQTERNSSWHIYAFQVMFYIEIYEFFVQIKVFYKPF